MHTRLLLILFLPMLLQAQAPVYTTSFLKNPSQAYGSQEASFSPRGSWLLVTYSALAGKSFYELYHLPSRKRTATGELPGSIYSIAWSEDEQRAALSLPGGKVLVASVEKGFRPLFTTAQEGEPVFRKNTLLLGPRTAQPLYLFGMDSIQVIDPSGKWLRAYETEDFNSYQAGWFDLLRNRFALMDISGDQYYLFSDKGEPKGSFPLPKLTILTGLRATADGALFLYHNSDSLLVVETVTGRQLLRIGGKKLASACFTPDNKAVLLATWDSLFLYGMDGRIRRSRPISKYYTQLGYTAFGSLLVAANRDGFEEFSCKDYFPPDPPPPPKTAPPVTTKPAAPVSPVNKPAPPPPAKPVWKLPYTIRDFVVPLERDSFFLYNTERGLRYHIRYKREPNMSLFANPYSYIQNFGFSNESKYWNVNVYTLETTEGDARLASYSESSQLQNGDLMFGGQNYLARIPVPPATTLSWSNKLYKDTYSLTATLVDHTWKGRKGKCLVVTRRDPARGIDESWYYLQGIGLVGIASGGKMAFER